MSAIQVQGLRPLKGEIEIQGSKNAVLPMMAAAVLHKGTTVLTHVPRIQDVFCMMGILEYIGCLCRLEGHRLTICAENLTEVRIPEQYVTAMRSSIVIVGALLGRCGEAAACYPGGCSIGKRPIDLHLYALRKLGAEIQEQEGRLKARTSGMKGTVITLSFPSVGATENALLGAVLAEGTTVICGAAREPEIEELCRMLSGMGARISGEGTDTLVVEGVDALHDSVFDVVGDRIAAGTYLSCVMAAGGQAVFYRALPRHMRKVLEVSRSMGARIREGEDFISVSMVERPRAVSVETSPYPGFPTDLQSPLLALLCVSQGVGRIRETIFEGRFATVGQLRKLGADIRIQEKTAQVTGSFPLTGGQVEATDLRGGAALVTAGLAAEGETRIGSSYHIFRGYEDICRDLKELGAVIREEAC